VTPILLFVSAVVYVFLISHMEKSMPVKIGMCIAGAYLGLQRRCCSCRMRSRRSALDQAGVPDALDLLLICIESGMSIEVAFRKVSAEIVTQSIALSENSR